MVKSQPILRYIRKVIPAVVLTTLFSTCNLANASVNTQTETHAVKLEGGFLLQASQDEFEKLVNSVDVKSRLMDQYFDWKGVRYRLGGNSKRGIDCSAFVQKTFREQFGLDLPRSTHAMSGSGKRIQRAKLRAGDLVLFRAGSTGRHVGIYLGNDNFVHASTSSGVMISNLNDSYWKNRFRDARRILTPTS
ncbi:MAG: Murein DD-endopeptidase MepS/Murein LD-carboxypeptidase [Candidatus Erwinia impunctatus]|nr:Murein DD-endopeptidase MepS/Murein LD-carboxypeptidase [Culicoides impunctatus]